MAMRLTKFLLVALFMLCGCFNASSPGGEPILFITLPPQLLVDNSDAIVEATVMQRIQLPNLTMIGIDGRYLNTKLTKAHVKLNHVFRGIGKGTEDLWVMYYEAHSPGGSFNRRLQFLNVGDRHILFLSRVNRKWRLRGDVYASSIPLRASTNLDEPLTGSVRRQLITRSLRDIISHTVELKENDPVPAIVSRAVFYCGLLPELEVRGMIAAELAKASKLGLPNPPKTVPLDCSFNPFL